MTIYSGKNPCSMIILADNVQLITTNFTKCAKHSGLNPR